MNDYFYIDASGQQKGPIPPSQFSMFNVSADTLVWCKGMADWQRAGAVDELKAYLENDANGATPPPTPGTAGTASGAPYDNAYHSMGSGTPQPVNALPAKQFGVGHRVNHIVLPAHRYCSHCICLQG